MAETVGLPQSSTNQLADRLRFDPELALPAHLERESGGEGEAPSQVIAERRDAYVRALLLRDAGVFLERHGRLLSTEELELFQPLCERSYEVNFYYRLLKQGTRSKRAEHVQARNRRLAYYNRNEGVGFFSLEAMRDRDPLLWQRQIGRYKQGDPAPRLDSQKVSDMLLEQHDAHELRVRLRAEQEREARREEMEEEETDSDEEEVQEDEGDGQAGQPRPVYGGIDAMQGEEYQPMHATEEERARLQDDFIETMKLRFINGKEEGTFDYRTVDRDACLDEDWARYIEQDAQDRYFDSD